MSSLPSHCAIAFNVFHYYLVQYYIHIYIYIYIYIYIFTNALCAEGWVQCSGSGMDRCVNFAP